MFPSSQKPQAATDIADMLKAIDAMEDVEEHRTADHRTEAVAPAPAQSAPPGATQPAATRSRYQYNNYLEQEELPGTLSNNQWLVLALVLLMIICGFAYRIFTRGAIVALSPAQGVALDANNLEFRWKCDKSDISFVVEVYDGTELVMRQITNETAYTPDQYQKSAFKANRAYNWIVIPNPDIEQKYKFKSDSHSFTITKEVPPPVDEPAPVVAPPPPAPPPPSSANSQKEYFD